MFDNPTKHSVTKKTGRGHLALNTKAALSSQAKALDCLSAMFLPGSATPKPKGLQFAPILDCPQISATEVEQKGTSTKLCMKANGHSWNLVTCKAIPSCYRDQRRFAPPPLSQRAATYCHFDLFSHFDSLQAGKTLEPHPARGSCKLDAKFTVCLCHEEFVGCWRKIWAFSISGRLEIHAVQAPLSQHGLASMFSCLPLGQVAWRVSLFLARRLPGLQIRSCYHPTPNCFERCVKASTALRSPQDWSHPCDLPLDASCWSHSQRKPAQCREPKFWKQLSPSSIDWIMKIAKKCGTVGSYKEISLP